MKLTDLFILNAFEWWIIYWINDSCNVLNWLLQLLDITELNVILVDNDITRIYVGLNYYDYMFD